MSPEDRRHLKSTRQPPTLPPRLLLLDDEEAILVPVASYLREEGHEVVTCREPEEAEALLAHRSFDLMVLDLALTRFGRQGLEVLGSVRATHPWMPVIVLSGNVCPETEQLARSLGADAVLCKPQPLAELARVVASLLGIGA